MWSTAKWRIPIPAIFGGGESEAIDLAEVAIAPPERVLATVGVMGLAVALAVLPVLTALGVGTQAVGQVAVGLGSLVAIAGGGKLAAVILGWVVAASGD